MKSLHLVIFFIALSFAVTASADIYRWVDENGVENFADVEWKVPEKYRKKAKVLREPKAVAPPEEPSAPVGEQQPKAAEGEPAKVKAAPDAEKAPSGPVDNEGHDEAWWRARVDTLKKKKADLEKELADIEAKVGQTGDRARIAAMGRSAEQQQDQVKLLIRRDEIKKEIAAIDYQLNTGLPDEARKAGAPPGWLR